MVKKNVNYEVIKIDAPRIDDACGAYFKWKDLNSYVSKNSTRGINIPDVISEPIGCYCLDLLWNRGKGGDATDPRTNKKIEFKATSRFEGDLSSFGPKCEFDDLIFLRFNVEENLVFVYDLNIDSAEFGKCNANKTQTISEQKMQGRRPHISLCDMFVKGRNMKPNCIFDIRRIKVYKPSSAEYDDYIKRFHS